MQRQPGGLRAFDQLLTQPQALLAEEESHASAPWWLLAGGLVGFVLYGAAAGCFQGGAQVLLAAFKAPLIGILALLLCLPSLYVFSALSGARWTRRLLFATVAGFTGTLGLLLAALLPVSWLFSVSSRYLASAVWVHVMIWLIALLFGWRFLDRGLKASGAGSGMALWLVLFAVVSLQVATFIRPVLWRGPRQPLFATGKMFFLEHYRAVLDYDEIMEEARKARESQKAGSAATQKPRP